ncbi:Uncharacterised protein [uncultured archaeon]|nr:Uncharacterised protein [uncultured archaeon]
MVQNKKAEGPMGMSFSMIFSIILIIFFVIVAFMAIRYFLKLQACTQIGDFVGEFQTKTTEAWNSQKADYELKKVLPSGIEYVCFADLSDNLRGENRRILDELEFFQGGVDANMFFYPKEKACEMPAQKIKHLDMAKLTKSKNPYCIEVVNGKVDIKIQKDFLDELVTISCVVGNCTPINLNTNLTFYSRPVKKTDPKKENYSVNPEKEVEEKNTSFNAVEFCKLINDSEESRICTKAVEEQTSSSYTGSANDRCNSIENPASKNLCYYATKNQYETLNNRGSQRDLSLCEQFNGDQVQKDLCIRHINAA